LNGIITRGAGTKRRMGNDVSADLKFPPFAGEENPPRVV